MNFARGPFSDQCPAGRGARGGGGGARQAGGHAPGGQSRGGARGEEPQGGQLVAAGPCRTR
eukprot:8543977-Pyramimonas_sp.AAC.1